MSDIKQFSGELLNPERPDPVMARVHFSPEQRQLALRGLRCFVGELEHHYIARGATAEGVAAAETEVDQFVEEIVGRFDRGLAKTVAAADPQAAGDLDAFRDLLTEVTHDVAASWDHIETSHYGSYIADLEQSATMKSIRLDLLGDALVKSAAALRRTGAPEAAERLEALVDKVLEVGDMKWIKIYTAEELTAGDRLAYLRIVERRGIKEPCTIAAADSDGISAVLSGSGELLRFTAAGKEAAGDGFLTRPDPEPGENLAQQNGGLEPE